MRRTFIFFLFLIFFLFWAPPIRWSQVVSTTTGGQLQSRPVAKVNPACPIPPASAPGKPGVATFHVTYDTSAPSALLQSPKSLTLVIGFYSSGIQEPIGIPMVKKGDTSWEAAVEPEEFWAYAMFYFEDENGKVDNNKSDFWDVMLCEPTPMSMAIRARADSYMGVSVVPEIERQVNYQKALESYEAERDRGLDYQTMIWVTKARMYGISEAGGKKLATDIDKYLTENWNNPRMLDRQVSYVAGLLGFPGFPTGIREKFISRTIALNPGSAERLRERAALALVWREEDSKKRIAAINDFLKKYPQTQTPGDLFREKFNIECRNHKDIPAAEGTFRQWSKRVPSSPEPNLFMGYCYVERATKLGEAIPLLTRVLEMEQDLGAVRPGEAPFLGPNGPSSRLSEQARYWRGRAYFAKGDYAAAIADFRQVGKAFLLREGEAQLYLSRALEANGNYPEAAEMYLKLVTNPCDQTIEARKAVERVYAAGKLGTPEELAKLILDRKEERRRTLVAKYFPRLLDREAPPFDFRTLEESRFNNDGQKGIVMVLNFWGIG